jgi:glucose dehydrogenase
MTRALSPSTGPLALALLATLFACGDDAAAPEAATPRAAAPAPSRGVAAIDDARLANAAAEPESWLSYGGTYAEQRFSRLDQIHAGNVEELGLAFFYDTHSTRGLEATPLFVDGVIYTTASWSVVHAVDARTGEAIWRYDPQVPGEFGAKACCDVVNRGVAAYAGRIYVGTLDGRLVALDARTGAVAWERLTVDPSKPYTITMAPRVVKGKVIIGNGGAELGVRGYVSAYDAASGELVWRFYTVPGDPSQPVESPALERALPTWTGDRWWKIGGGGTVWDAVAFAWDPVNQRKVWEQPYPSPWNGGTLTTAGGLVFQGTAHGTFAAYDATSGRLLWETPVGTGVMAAPSTYRLDGEQYVAVMVGWGGAFGLVGGDAAAAAHERAGGSRNEGRLLVFKLGGTARIPATEATLQEISALAGDFDPEEVKRGNFAYHRWCAFCHGIGAISGGVLPDLRHSEVFFSDALEPIVLEGRLLAKGMPDLSEWLSRDDLARIRDYVAARRNALAQERSAAKAKSSP